MHWVSLLLMLWLPFSVATVLGLFWLCKKSAQTLSSSVSRWSLSPKAEFHSKPVRQVPLPYEQPSYAETEALRAQSQIS